MTDSTNNTEPNEAGTEDQTTSTRKAITLSEETILVRFTRGTENPVGTVGFFVLSDEGTPVAISVNPSWRETYAMADALKKIGSAEKTGNVSTDVLLAEENAATVKAATEDKLSALIAQAQALGVDVSALLAGIQGTEDAAEDGVTVIAADSEDSEDSEDSDN